MFKTPVLQTVGIMLPLEQYKGERALEVHRKNGISKAV
jgi:hypothetical protein